MVRDSIDGLVCALIINDKVEISCLDATKNEIHHVISPPYTKKSHYESESFVTSGRNIVEKRLTVILIVL
jgi:hypothetical protein